MLICFQARYDIDHALVLAQMHHFKAGILYLYEKAKLWVHSVMRQNTFLRKWAMETPNVIDYQVEIVEKR